MSSGTSLWRAGGEVRAGTGREKSEDTNLTLHWLERFSAPMFEELRPRPTQLNTVLIDAVRSTSPRSTAPRPIMVSKRV